MRFSLPRWLRSVRDVLGTPSRPTQRFRPALEALEDRTVPTATTITGILTADNHYALYHGSGDASTLTLVGRNEAGYGGNPGTYNWSEAETFTFDANPGDYLYAIVWDDTLQQMFAGQFMVDDVTLRTNAGQWQYAVGGSKPGENADLPATADLQGVIGNASWQTPAASAANGAGPWGTIAGLNADVHFLWPDTLDSESFYNDQYIIFRTAAPVVPVNHPPTANDDSAVTNQGQPLTLTLAQLLANDTDPDGDTLQVTAVSPTSAHGGTVSLDANAGTLTYTPTASHFGSDTFTYTITDGHGWTDTATVQVDVFAVTGVTGTLTADNHYGLYYGAGDGSSMHLVGRNEKGSGGNPGTYNWSLPETHQFNVNTGDYIYVVVWDDGGPQSWIGQFELPGGGTLVSNTTDWEYVLGGNNPGESGDAPTEAQVMADITNVTWSSLNASAANGSAPWGTIPGLSGDAQFVWHDTLGSDSSSDGRYVIYRTSAAVDLPPTISNPGPQTSAERDVVHLQITGTDPENEAIHYAAAGLPDGLTINATTGLISGTLTCDANDLTGGQTVVTITATDTAGGHSSQTFVWTITNVAVKNVFWTGDGDGYRWNDADNWDIRDVPECCDEVFIDAPGLTVIHESGDVAIHSLHSSANITFTGGLTLATASNVSGALQLDGTLRQESGALDLAGGGSLGGTLTADAGAEINFLAGSYELADGVVFDGVGAANIGGQQTDTARLNIAAGETISRETWNLKENGSITGSGTLTITKELNWTGGSQDGNGKTVIAIGAELKITGTGAKQLSNRKLENAGSIQISGASLVSTAGAQITNLTDATFEMIGGVSLESPDGSLSVTNQGTFKKTGDSATSEVAGTVLNRKEMIVATGTIYFSGGFAQQDAGTHTRIDTGAKLVGRQLSILGGDVRVDGVLLVNGPPTAMGDPNLVCGDTIFIGDGLLSIDGGAVVSITGDVGFTSVSSSGTIYWRGGDITLGRDFLNSDGASFVVLLNNGRISGMAFENDGLFEQRGGGAIELTSVFNNRAGTEVNGVFAFQGKVRTLAGDINFTATGEHTGLFEAAFGTEIRFTNAAQLNTGAALNGAGTYRVFDGGKLLIPIGSEIVAGNVAVGQGANGFGAIAGPGTLVVLGSFTWTAGEIDAKAVIDLRGTTTIAGADEKLLDQTALLVNRGTVAWTNGNIRMSDGANIVNYGTFDVHTDGAMLATVAQPPGVFLNEVGGSFYKASGFGVTSIDVPFENKGSVALAGYSLDFTAFVQTDASAVTSLDNGTLSSINVIRIREGILRGPGTVSASVVVGGLGAPPENGAPIEPATRGVLDFGFSMGSLTINGDLAMGPNGEVFVFIEGRAAGTQYNQIVVSGQANLVGKLTVGVLFAAAAGDTFSILRSGRMVAGTFFTVTLGDLDPNLQWAPVSYTSDVVLNVINKP